MRNVVLKKKRTTTDVIFEDGERSIRIPVKAIEENGYTLSVNTYLPEETQQKEIDIDEVNHLVVRGLLREVEATFESLRGLSQMFDDNFYVDELWQGLKDILRRYKE